MPTEYQKGMLQGLECARTLVAYERDKHDVEGMLQGLATKAPKAELPR